MHTLSSRCHRSHNPRELLELHSRYNGDGAEQGGAPRGRRRTPALFSATTIVDLEMTNMSTFSRN